MDLNVWIARIRAKLWDLGIEFDYVESADEAETALRTNRIDFLYPPADEGEVVMFEAGVGQRLPEDYRRFILEVGNGGFGPGHERLFRLGTRPGAWECDPATIRRPFRFTEAFRPTPAWLAETTREEQLTITDGTLDLCHHSCGTTLSLVMNGPRAGQVWGIDLANEGVFPLLGDEVGPMRFADWYESHCDAVARCHGLTVFQNE